MSAIRTLRRYHWRMPGVFFIIIVIAIIVGVSVAQSRRDALNRSWGDVAAQLGLSLREATMTVSPQLLGDVGGFPVKVDIQKKGSGKSSSTWTRFSLDMPSLAMGLQLKAEGFMSSVSKVFGVQDVEVGNHTFDEQVQVKARNEVAVREFLTPERCAAILRFMETHPGTVITDQQISWSTRGRISDSHKMLSTVREMQRLGAVLGEAQQTDAIPVTAGLAAAPAAAALTRIDPGLIDAAEPGAAMERKPEPPTVVADDSPGAPLAVEAEAEAEAGADARAEVDPDADADADANADADIGAGGPGVAEFCDTVFASGALSFEATRRFDEQFKGQDVHWVGTLLSANPYSYDFDFGPGKGVKATVVVHTLKTSAFGDGAVKAVVQLPADAGDLESRIGDVVEFTGRLMKVDGLMHKVLVAEARLI